MDACAEDELDPSTGDEALSRAEQLVTAAAERLQAQDEQLESVYGLIECLLDLSPPMAIVEGSVVRAWSPALEALTGVRRTTALGSRLARSLPSLAPADRAPWRWTDPNGAAWAVTVRSGGPDLRVLLWKGPVGAADDPWPRSSDPFAVDEPRSGC